MKNAISWHKSCSGKKPWVCRISMHSGTLMNCSQMWNTRAAWIKFLQAVGDHEPWLLFIFCFINCVTLFHLQGIILSYNGSYRQKWDFQGIASYFEVIFNVQWYEVVYLCPQSKLQLLNQACYFVTNNTFYSMYCAYVCYVDVTFPVLWNDVKTLSISI